MAAVPNPIGEYAHGRMTPTPTRERGPAWRGRIRGLGDLAATVPYLLGFVPRDSVTCLGLVGDLVVLTARMDLPDALHPTAGLAAMRSVVGAIERAGAHSLVALVSSDTPTDPALVDRIALLAREHDLDLVDIAWHAGERCRSLLCEPGCCPPEGVAIDRACPSAVAATYAGVVPLPDRADVEAEFDRPNGVDLDAVLPWLDAAETAAIRAVVEGRGEAHCRAESEFVLQTARRFDACVDPGAPMPKLSDPVVGRLVVGLSAIPTRDAVWMAIDARECHGEGLWLELAHRAPSPYDAAPLFLLGWRCWRRGDGVRAAIAVDRAAASDPRCSAAALLGEAIDAGVGPNRIPPLGQAIEGWPRAG